MKCSSAKMNFIIKISFFFLCLCCFTKAYRPTIIIHGIMFNATDRMEYLGQEIRNSQPDTAVEIIEILYGIESFYPMWVQVSEFYQRFVIFMNSNPGPINVIAYSQGGLIARAVIQSTINHTVSSFISLSSPQNGFHGEFYVPKSIFSVGNEEKFSDSVGGFWKHPRDMARYKKEGRFLACINNEYPHEKREQFKNTMCRLKQLVLIGGPDDGVVVPWQSAHFGFDDAQGRIINMEQQPIFLNDNFCLQTLSRRGAITKYTVPGVRHPDWHNNLTVIQNYILPHLV